MSQTKAQLIDGKSSSIEFTAGSASTPSIYFTSDINTGIYSPGADQLAISTDGSERARIDSSGRLLVGTSSVVNPFGSRLTVAGTGAGRTLNFAAFENDVDGALVYLSKSRSSTVGTNTIVQNGDTLGRFAFYGADGSGYVNAGEITCSVDGTPGSNDMPGRLVFSTTADGASSPTERMRITNDGSVGIGTPGNTTNAYQDVDFRCFIYSPGGSTSSQIYIDSRKADAFVNINQTYPDTLNRSAVLFARNEAGVGSISISSAQVFYNTTSDYRLKENIVDVVNGIDLVKQLQPREFNFISEPEKTIAGFIAHEVEAVVPNAIFGEKDAINDEGDPVYQSIDQSKLVPILTAALKEAIAKIETLEAKVAALETQ